MKISLSWILDHIKIDKKTVDVPALIARLNATTAEIDGYDCVSSDLSTLFIGRIIEQKNDEYSVEIPELKRTVTLSARKDASVHSLYVIKKDAASMRWATLEDVGSSKNELLPALWIPEQDLKGAWRNTLESNDTIIELDNKAVTNRPDLWCHRGFAREIAALLNKELVSEDQLLATLPIKHFSNRGSSNGAQPLEVEISQDDQTCLNPCRRFSALRIAHIENRPSLLFIAVRLARIDARPIDALVDMTNYVMYDIGQPMHAFDAEKVPSKKLVGRCARKGEKLTLLDGEEVTFDSSDYVITDGEKPLALAGIMGGLESAVIKETKALILEAANFDPTTIRRTANRLKKRTESAARFEKNLDPNVNTQAILRYLKLLQTYEIAYQASESIISLGPLMHEKIIDLTHEALEDKIGIPIAPHMVTDILKKLGFGVEHKKDESCKITVPTFRATKDVTIAEDVIEEVARFVGYSSIPAIPPKRAMLPFDVSYVQRKRALKQIIGYGLLMRETYGYAFYDEEFLREIKYNPIDALEIANPLSEHWQRLVTSLVPNLLKVVVTNKTGADSLRYFELNRVWFIDDKPVEAFECAGIWYEHKKPVDFYEGKELVSKIFEPANVTVKWLKPTKNMAPWYDPYQSAQLWVEDRIVGRAGKASRAFLDTILEGEAFIFELDANYLCNAERAHYTFKPLSKYPKTDLDISMLVPLSCTVAGLEEVIRAADKRIAAACLIDSFQKPEWPDKKSITIRFTAYDSEGTLDKLAIDTIWQHVVQAVTAIGAQVR